MRGREGEVKREGGGKWEIEDGGRVREGEGRREEKGDTSCNCPDHLFL